MASNTQDSSEKGVKEEVVVSLASTPSPVEDVMDGGREAWCTVAGGFLVVAVTFGYANSFGVYQDFYTRSQTASASAISWIGSTQLFFLLAMALPGGKLLDMGYFRHTTFIGSLILVFSLFMVSICDPQKYYQLYLAQGLGVGIGSGLLYVPCLAVQSHHWRARRAYAMGIVATGSSLGGIMFPIVLNELFKSSLGFHWGVRVSAFMGLAMLGAANILMTPKKKFNSNAQDRPDLDLKGIMTDVPYLISIFAMFFANWGIFFPYFYLQLFAILHGVNHTTAFYLIAIMNAAAVPGRIFPSMLADHFGPYNVITPALLSCTVLIYAMMSIGSLGSVIVFAILYGFMSGATLTLAAPAFAVLSRHPSEVGVRFGIAFSLTAFGALIGTPVTGALLGDHFRWNKPIIFSGVSCTVAFIFLMIVRQVLVKRKGTQLV
ncbi:hypothetical protein NLJ89_g11085 [Agrocybe chaxingu]|uniref:Major facilitator superfamily (MFS) profile domain-containing protein n=1 Tax=Agrocybe chaxingu TaxID=84603 RepID=A0A9W8JWY5_9AGAR|nr:hypothetical protein NLJ89_g11085 [Agrocybe chaxingu]